MVRVRVSRPRAPAIPLCMLPLLLHIALLLRPAAAQNKLLDLLQVVHFGDKYYALQFGTFTGAELEVRNTGVAITNQEDSEFFTDLVAGRPVQLPIFRSADQSRLSWQGSSEALAVFDPLQNAYIINQSAFLDQTWMGGTVLQNDDCMEFVQVCGVWTVESYPFPCTTKREHIYTIPAPGEGAVRFNNSYYVLVEEPELAVLALERAEQQFMLGRRGHMASIDSPEENEFVTALLQRRGVRAAWVGATFFRPVNGSSSSREWTWRMTREDPHRSHEPYPFATRSCPDVSSCTNYQPVPGRFANWSTIPDSVSPIGASALLRDHGGWERVSVDSLARYAALIEFPATRSAALTDVRRVGHKEFRFVSDRVGFYDAQHAASLLQPSTTLPAIDSHAENYALSFISMQWCQANSFAPGVVLSLRTRRVWTGARIVARNFDWATGVDAGVVLVADSGIPSTGVLLYPGIAYRRFNSAAILGEPCMAVEHMIWRFGDCNRSLGLLVGQVDPFEVGGTYLRSSGLVAGFLGALQIAAQPGPGSLTKQLPMPTTKAEFDLLLKLMDLFDLRFIFLGAIIFQGDTYYLDGTPIWLRNQTPHLQIYLPPGFRSDKLLDPGPGSEDCLILRQGGVVTLVNCDSLTRVVFLHTPNPRPIVFQYDPCVRCFCVNVTTVCLAQGLHSLQFLPPTTTDLNLALNNVKPTRERLAFLPGLKQLDLSGNGITTLSDDAFADLRVLAKVSLSQNSLTELPDFSYTALQDITLSENAITELVPARLPPSVVHVDLARNFITELPTGALGGLLNLQRINLAGNRITSASPGVLTSAELGLLTLNRNPCDSACFAALTLRTTTVASTTSRAENSNNEGGSSSGGGTVVAAAGAAAAVACLLLAACVVVALRRRHHSRVSTGAHFEMEALLSDKVAEAFHARFPQVRLEAQTFEYDFSHKVVAWPELQGLDVAKLQGHRQATWHRRRGQAEGGAGAVAESVLVLLRGAGQQSPEGKRELLIEARLLEYLKHPSVVPLLGVTTRGPLYMVLAHEHESDLRTFLRRQRATSSTRTREVTPQDLVLLATQVAAALSFLEQRSIAHCSLKASNCLVRVGEQLSVKLGTLGTATHADPTAQCVAGVSEDDVPWYSPEVLRYGQFSSKSDVFAFGVLLYEMASFGKQPWGLSSMAEVRTEVLAGSRLTVPAQCPKLLLEVMLQGWQDKAQLRPSFATLYSDLLMRRAGRGSRAVRPRLLGEEDIDFVRDLSPGGGIRLYSVKADGALVAGHMAQGQSRATQILAEARLLRCLRHENVARLLGVVEGAAPVMLTEYFGEGSLRAFLRERDGLARKQVLGLGGDVALGVQYLAACQIVHRQVSSSNCFLREGRVVLAGFGLTRQVVATEEYLSTRAQAAGELGVREMAPESIQRRVFSKASDVFCLGVVLHEVFHGGRGPFEGVAAASFLSGLAAGRLPAVRTTAAAVELMDAGVARMLGACLQMLPEGRPRAGDVAGALADAVAGTDRWEYEGELTFVRELGAGAFGTVAQMVASDLPAPGGSMVVAVKVLLDDSEQGVAEFMAETRLMKKLQHPNLTSLLGVCTRSTPLRMILEFQSGGSLLDYLEATPTSEEERLLILNQIACGMASLHEHNIIHRDLAARNCLVGDGLQIKVADFGLSRETTEEDYYRMATERALPLRWIAPEILQTMKFTRPSDVWSFGILIFELHNPGVTPFRNLQDRHVVKALSRGNLAEVLVPESTIGAVQRHCLVLSALARPTFTTLCSMLAPWHHAPTASVQLAVEEDSTAV